MLVIQPNEVPLGSYIHKNLHVQATGLVNKFRVLVGVCQQALQPQLVKKIIMEITVRVQDRPP
jgi:hypothetical protein